MYPMILARFPELPRNAAKVPPMIDQFFFDMFERVIMAGENDPNVEYLDDEDNCEFLSLKPEG